ncbi:hypothetical protein Sjap_004649 [Stephania japonica]|uniref:RRM domain-containing protein n=1 Tax=Stephania japonica TaxID=461633 RepID=A0AAP0PL37_9MAGN
MPPRAAKRGGNSSGAKRGPGRAAKKTNQRQAVEENVKVEVKVEEVKVAETVVEEQPVVRAPKIEPKTEENGSGPVKDEDDVKEAFEEDDKGERLELEDNEVEYEPEEETGLDYDEKGMEHEDVQEEEEVIEEGPEGDMVEEEEEEMGEEEMEEVGDEIEGEEDEENDEEEHAELADGEDEEHHDVVKERRKRKEFEVFVGGLDKDATEDDLKKVFSAVGEVAELKDKLKHYGIDNFEDLTLVEDSNNEGLNRGFAFLEFASRSDAMDAYKRLQKRDVSFGVDRSAKIAFADSFIEPDDEIMAQVKTVFVDGLPPSWDEDRVKDHLKKFGAIEKVELARNMPSAKRKDFGFVTFDTHDCAVACAETINNKEIGEGNNKVKVRARLSRPLQRARGKRGDLQFGRGASRSVRGSWDRPMPRSYPVRSSVRGTVSRVPVIRGRAFKAPVSYRDRRPIMAVPERVRPLPPPPVRSYSKKPGTVPSYVKSSSKREYSRRDEIPSRSRVAHMDYSARALPERRMSYGNDYPSRGSGYVDDLPRSAARAAPRRAYVDEGYDRRFERPPPSYHEGRGREYESLSGSKRHYSSLDDVPPRYAEPSLRQSRARVEYGAGASASHYGDTYSDRLGRSELGYGGSRTLSAQEPHGVYRQGMSYSGGSYGGHDVGGMYSSSYSSDYVSRRPDVTSSSIWLVTALILLSILAVTWVAAAIWEVVALVRTTENDTESLVLEAEFVIFLFDMHVALRVWLVGFLGS